MKKSLFKEFKKHINEVANGYEESHLTSSYDEKVKELIKNFKTEYGSAKMIQYHRGVKNSFTAWINGLPSCIDTLYTWHDIKEFWKSIDLDLWNGIKDMDYGELYRIYIYEAINEDYDIISYIFNSLELENLKRKDNQ